MMLWTTETRMAALWLTLAVAAPQLGEAQATDFDSGRNEQILFDTEVQVLPGEQYRLPFTTNSNFRRARIAGSVQAVGGAANDIRVLVAHGRSIVFDSGRRRTVVLSVDYSEPGEYTLIFDNRFSLLSPKVVSGKISLVHWGIDAERDAADLQARAKNYSQASRIMQKLYSTLKTDEQVWATSQLSALPTIQLNNDRSVNAWGNWVTNSIQANRGVFDLSDNAGAKGDAVIAAVLAHELSHIFYRHSGYGSGQGVKGLLDELQGVTALDRVQEKEADVLGIRVVCQAGFDPDGMLILMRAFAALDGRANSFMRNHPTGIERLSYLQLEAAKCRYPVGVQTTATATQATPTIVTRIALLQNVCTDDLLHKNHESNVVLFEVLNRFYSELEGQFRMQVQRSTKIRFLYYGTPSANAPAKFGFTRIIGLSDAAASCDATIYSSGEIQTINPSMFQATVYIGIRRNATAAEQRNLSEVDKGNTLTLWHYKLVSNVFSDDKLRYTADLHALQLAASFISATKNQSVTR
jgi:hypothetical protein